MFIILSVVSAAIVVGLIYLAITVVMDLWLP